MLHMKYNNRSTFLFPVCSFFFFKQHCLFFDKVSSLFLNGCQQRGFNMLNSVHWHLCENIWTLWTDSLPSMCLPLSINLGVSYTWKIHWNECCSIRKVTENFFYFFIYFFKWYPQALKECRKIESHSKAAIIIIWFMMFCFG